jgi:RNA methyltransferase, TrmH family
VQITSRHNPVLQEVRRAVSAGRLMPGGLVVAEGPHLLEEALRGSWTIERIVATASARQKYDPLLYSADSEVVEVSETAFKSIAATEHNQGVLTILKPRDWSWKDLLVPAALLVVLDGIQDPGNAGTLVRSAEAFGASGVIFGRGSVHIANSKFLRATVGSIFRLPFVSGAEPREVLTNFRAGGIQVYGLAAKGELAIQDVDLRPSCALVTGSEGAGLSAEWREHSAAVRIPAAQVESLNAAVACSIALFEASRQRADGKSRV